MDSGGTRGDSTFFVHFDYHRLPALQAETLHYPARDIQSPLLAQLDDLTCQGGILHFLVCRDPAIASSPAGKSSAS